MKRFKFWRLSSTKKNITNSNAKYFDIEEDYEIIDASFQQVYNMGLHQIESWRFWHLLQGLTFDDKNPFGYIVFARQYDGQYSKSLPDIHKKMMSDKHKFKLQNKNNDNNLMSFKEKARLFS